MQIGVEASRAVENKRVFVVDSDEITRAALQFMLHDENETHELDSVDKALAKGREWRPDLILIGLAIIVDTGVGVLADLAARFPGVKILVVADSDQNPLVRSCLNAGAHAVLAKPLTIEGARYKVDVLLGRRRVPLIPLTVLMPT